MKMSVYVRLMRSSHRYRGRVSLAISCFCCPPASSTLFRFMRCGFRRECCFGAKFQSCTETASRHSGNAVGTRAKRMTMEVCRLLRCDRDRECAFAGVYEGKRGRTFYADEQTETYSFIFRTAEGINSSWATGNRVRKRGYATHWSDRRSSSSWAR